MHVIVVMVLRRATADARLLCAGPGRLCQALGIDAALDGRSLFAAPFMLKQATGAVEVIAGPRIGISKAIDHPWRFGLTGSRFLSRPFPKQGT